MLTSFKSDIFLSNVQKRHQEKYPNLYCRPAESRLIVKLCTETKEQGGVLTETDIAILLRVSITMISNHVTSYEEKTKRPF